MKLYSKITGIILTLIGIGALIFIVLGIFGQNSIDDKVMVSLLFIPCIIYLHFMYIHNFGFNLKTEIPQKNYKIILILTLLSLIISVIVPTGYLLSQINLESTANKMVERGENKSDLDLKANLKTKFEDGELMYIINISKGNNQELDLNYYESFLFNLYDKDGFLIKKIDIAYFTTVIDKNNKTYGIISNSSQDITLKEYLKISKWELLYVTN